MESRPPAEGTSFTQPRRGYDSGEVNGHIQDLLRENRELAGRVADLERRLAEAREAEQAVQLTFKAATDARKELEESAAVAAEETLQAARREAKVIRDEAKAARLVADEQAERLMAEAKRDALRLIEAGRADAEDLSRRLQSEHRATILQVRLARTAVEAAVRGVAATLQSSLGALREMGATLDDHADLLAEHAPEGAAAAAETAEPMEAPAVAAAPAPCDAGEPQGEEEASHPRQDGLLAALKSLTSR